MATFMIQDLKNTDEQVINNTCNDILIQKLNDFKQKLSNIQQDTSLSLQIKNASLKHYIILIEKQLQYRENIVNYQNKINNLFNIIHTNIYDIIEEKIVNMIREYKVDDTYMFPEDLYFSIINEYINIEKLFNIYMFNNNNEQNILSLYTNLLYNNNYIDDDILEFIDFENLDIIDIKKKNIDKQNELFMNKNIFVEYDFYRHTFKITIKYPSFNNL